MPPKREGTSPHGHACGTASHRRSKTILAVVHARRLKSPIGQLFRGTDKNLRSWLQVDRPVNRSQRIFYWRDVDAAGVILPWGPRAGK